MNWTSKAEQLLDKTPAFIGDKLRVKLEAKAAQLNLGQIDSHFVKKHTHNDQGSATKCPQPKVSDSPLTQAFARKYAVHAAMMGGTKREGNLQETLQQEIMQTPQNRPGMAYIHIPFCCSRCHFCGFYAESSIPAVMDSYVNALALDIARSGQLLKSAGQQLQAVYFGGGTPTDLSAENLKHLLETLHKEVPLTADCEITLEGRLYGFNDHKVQTVLDGGVNRFSFGVQSFNTQIRQQVGRKQPREEVIERLNRIAELAEPFQAAVIIDLIYGLPGQTETEWLQDINSAINNTQIHGLDLYQINIIPSTPLMAIKDKLPPMANLQQRANLFSKGNQTMLDAGFTRLSIAHWSRDLRERNRYNSGNKRGDNCLPLGSGAGGRWGAVSFYQQSDINRYQDAIKLGEKPLAMGVTMPPHYPITLIAIDQLEQQYLDITKLEEAAEHPLCSDLLPMIEHWEAAGLLCLKPSGKAELTEAGEFWVVNLQYLIDVSLKEILCAK
ncbi:oxygen-independent coproporphyrinogen-3 oxidase [Desulfuromusa kysingii]|uniref:Oxygen-independent coproporphyrinogen-3 oxidase n=1 Tax=Desulfuromusa kysingii TaxID=37625 RepID=A0A1H3VSC9_9BACT|nr:heme anaerobic degradation radical SAM methyltransferase ChuW/HutW [Desulfuromusa kysingii]SDZ77676.1 oxygen-independent coproporphyrinogen-3 oxidase [Desulfuromusa kysingii]